MRVPSESELFRLWEDGLCRHPIDRALLLCAWARPEVAAGRFAMLPLGTLNRELLRMRAALFGARLELQAVCAHCGETLDIPLAVADLLGAHDAPEDAAEIECAGFRFRLPASRDLAAVAYELDPELAALRLLDSCCVGRPEDASVTQEVLAEAGARLEAADPLADMSLSVACAACGAHSEVALDAGAILWDDMQAHARDLLAQVHALAGAYGWSEREILALPPHRRAAYLALVATRGQA